MKHCEQTTRPTQHGTIMDGPLNINFTELYHEVQFISPVIMVSGHSSLVSPAV